MTLQLNVDAEDLLRPRQRKPRSKRRRLGAIVLDIVVLIVGLLMIAPLVWLFTASLTEPGSAFTLPPKWVPQPFSWANYQEVFELIPIGRMALNSLIVAVITVGGSLLVSVLAAYGFSRLAFRGRDVILVAILSAMMIPPQLIIIPVFVLMRNLNLVDTLTALWLPLLINVFAIFFLRQYFNSIPGTSTMLPASTGRTTYGSCSECWCRCPLRPCPPWRSSGSRPPGTTTSDR